MTDHLSDSPTGTHDKSGSNDHIAGADMGAEDHTEDYYLGTTAATTWLLTKLYRRPKTPIPQID